MSGRRDQPERPERPEGLAGGRVVVLSLADPAYLARVRELVLAVRGLLVGPQRWTRGPLARDGRGRPVDPGSPVAARWCLVGAVMREADQLEQEQQHTAAAPAGSGDLDEVAAGPAGRRAHEALVLLGAMIAVRLEEAGLGTLERDGFRVESGAAAGATVPYSQLPGAFNDFPGNRYRSVATLLTSVEAALGNELRTLAQNPAATQRTPRRSEGGDPDV